MASLHISELFRYVAFSTFYLLSTVFILLLLYVSKAFLSFLLFYLKTSHRPPVAGTVFHQIIYYKTLHDYFTKLSLKHKTFTLLNPTHSDIYTTDPANIEYFLKTNFSNYNKGKFNHEIMTDLFGDGIFAVDGDMWKHQRKLASYEFSTKVLRNFSSDVFRRNAAKLAKRVAELAGSETSVDMQDLVMKSIMNSIFKVGFGVELETPSGTDASGVAFSKAFDESNQITFRRYIDIFWKAKRNFNIGLEAKLKRNLKLIDEFIYQLILTKRKQMESRANGEMKEDILSRFMLASQKDAAMNDKYLRDIILNFLIAGKDTTTNTLSWFFYLLCKTPLVQEKIVAEIKEVTGFQRGGSIDEFVHGLTEEVLIRLQYLHAAFSETLRLFPVVALDGRFAAEDDELPDGFKVKKGEVVYYTSYAMGRMTFLWGEDAEEFRPERWLKNGTFLPESPYKFISFNAGPRTCLGKDFAFRQMKIFAATLLHFFKFKLENESTAATYKTTFTLEMEKGLQVIALPRF